MIKFLLFGSNSISCDPIPDGVEKNTHLQEAQIRRQKQKSK